MSLVVHWHQRDVAAVALKPGSLTPSDRQVVSAIADAKARGLAVLVFPIVWVEKRAEGKWRGTLAPTDRDRWWLAYEAFVLHYTGLADVAGAEWMSVGSELGSTETWRLRWYHLISRVQRSTDARLLYSANWDHFSQVSFWKRLDAVGINGYVPIAKSSDAQLSEMTAAWRKNKAILVSRAKKLKLPLVLTEVGYLSRDGGAVRPWDYTSPGGLDLEEQRRAYESFRKVWQDERSLAGVLFWDWNGEGGAKDRGYTPRGKPAAAIVRRFFEGRLSASVRE